MLPRAFGELKRHLTSAPVLKFLDFKKPFKVHTDASDFVIGGVLMQEGRLVAFKSKKLSDVERRWPTHEKKDVGSSTVPQVMATLLGARVH